MITPARWNELCEAVRNAMASLVAICVTPIGYSESLDRGIAWATGNYVQFHGVPYLLTNEHVFDEAVGGHLSHFPGSTEYYVLLNSTVLADPWPVDVALTRVELGRGGAEKEPVPASFFDERYQPVTSELLLWIGFPGSEARRNELVTDFNRHCTWFGTPLDPPGFPMLMQQVPSSPSNLRAYDAEKHIIIHYPAKALKYPGEAAVDVPNPKGMSGSLLWDTKFVARTTSGQQWTADDARVCGVIWAAHDKPEVVVATKIEYIRPSLVHFLREECAYFHWIDRGRPLGDDLIDWQWAEQKIRDL